MEEILLWLKNHQVNVMGFGYGYYLVYCVVIDLQLCGHVVNKEMLCFGLY